MSIENDLLQAPRLLPAVFQRVGLDRLWTLKNETGLQDAVTHIALGRALYTPTAEQGGLKAEFMRVPVIDGYQLSEIQHAYYAEATYTGSKQNEPIGEIAYLLSDGTPLAIYSGATPEAYMTPAVKFRLIYSLIVDAIPTGSLNVINTEIFFQPGIREAIAELATTSILHSRSLAQKALSLEEHARLIEANRLATVKTANDADAAAQQVGQRVDDTNAQIEDMRTLNVGMATELLRQNRSILKLEISL